MTASPPIPHYTPRNSKYPVYSADQFLTSTNLNDTNDYLEKEIRATRSYLIGNGVVNGLDQMKANFVMSGGVPTAAISNIQVNAGYALTTDGYLLETPGYYPTRLTPGPLIFTHWYKKTLHMMVNINPSDPNNDVHRVFIDNDKELDEFYNPVTNTLWETTGTYIKDIARDCVELFIGLADPNIDTTLAAPTALSSLGTGMPSVTLDNSVLVFMADMINTSNASCGVGSCDDTGINRKMFGRFFLVPVAFLEGTANITYNSHPFTQITRLPSLTAVPDLATHYANVNEHFTDCQTTVANQLDVFRTHFPKLLPNEDMNAALKKLNSFNIAAYPSNLVGYYHHFAKDLHLAVTEYTKVYNDITYKFPDLNETRIDRIVVLGHVLNTNSMDPFRYYWSPVLCSCGGQCDVLGMKKHYARIISMINSFIYDPQVLLTHMKQAVGSGQSTIKVIPSKEPHNLLGDKCIPHYYDMTTSINPLYAVAAKAPNNIPLYPPDFKGYPDGYAGNTGIAVANNLSNNNMPVHVSEVTVDKSTQNTDAVPTEMCNGVPTQYTGSYNLLENWKSHAVDVHIEQVNNYYIPPVQTPAVVNTTQTNFVKVEGHYGLPVETAHAAITTQLSTLNVAVNVVHATPPDKFATLATFPTCPIGAPGVAAGSSNCRVIGGGAVMTFNLATTPELKGSDSMSGAFVGGTHVLVNDGASVIHCTTLSHMAPIKSV